LPGSAADHQKFDKQFHHSTEFRITICNSMKKQKIIAVAVALVLGALVYSQFRTWRSFDWGQFWAQTRGVNLLLIAVAVCCTYSSYLLRAVRWKVFLKPVQHARARDLVAPTMIGFTGLALLGRPGEFVRPYLIARREGLTVTSQMGVWTLERIFDLGAFAMLLSIDILVSKQLQGLQYFAQIREAGYVLAGGTVVLGFALFFTHRWTDTVAKGLYAVFALVSKDFARGVEHKVRSFGEGLHTLRDLSSLLQALGLSVAIWLVIALGYLSIVHSYPGLPQSALAPVSGLRVLPNQMKLSHIFPLVASSMAGSILQLPAVGGGSQLAIIAVLIAVFQVPRELAVSCGILLWLVTFMACVPLGLLLARHQHISFKVAEAEAEAAEQEALTTELSRHSKPGTAGG
jgi:uncharacterized protein (TIRG00374 family)